jgi:hypothetical protein
MLIYQRQMSLQDENMFYRVGLIWLHLRSLHSCPTPTTTKIPTQLAHNKFFRYPRLHRFSFGFTLDLNMLSLWWSIFVQVRVLDVVILIDEVLGALDIAVHVHDIITKHSRHLLQSEAFGLYSDLAVSIVISECEVDRELLHLGRRKSPLRP